jgi:hypothetical protein
MSRQRPSTPKAVPGRRPPSERRAVAAQISIWCPFDPFSLALRFSIFLRRARASDFGLKGRNLFQRGTHITPIRSKSTTLKRVSLFLEVSNFPEKGFKKMIAIHFILFSL